MVLSELSRREVYEILLLGRQEQREEVVDLGQDEALIAINRDPSEAMSSS